MLKNVMLATIYVSDQDRALAFYTQSLGLAKGAEADTRSAGPHEKESP